MTSETAIACISTFQRLATLYGDATINDWKKDKKVALIKAVSKYKQLNYYDYKREISKIEG